MLLPGVVHLVQHHLQLEAKRLDRVVQAVEQVGAYLLRDAQRRQDQRQPDGGLRLDQLDIAQHPQVHQAAAFRSSQAGHQLQYAPFLANT